MGLKNVVWLLGKHLGISYIIYMMGAKRTNLACIGVVNTILVVEEVWKRTAKRRRTAIDEKKENFIKPKDSSEQVQIDNVERSEWLNTMIQLLWPYIGKNVKHFIKYQLEPTIKQQFISFTFDTIELGGTPVKIGEIEVYAEDELRNEIIMDLNVIYKGDCHFQVSSGVIKAGIKDFQFNGKIRVIMKPLKKEMPLIGGVQVYLLEKPEIEFDATNLIGFMDLPGLKELIRNFLSSQFVLPNKSTKKILPAVPSRMIHMLQPKGVLRISVIEAKDLMIKDFLTSDPYAIITVRGEEFRTQTINSNLNPQWNYSCEYILDVYRNLTVTIQLFDYDLASKDENLGWVSFSYGEILEKESNDFWLPLDRAETGQIHLQFQWFQLNNDKRQLQTNVSSKLKKAGCSNCVLVVYIDSAKQLPFIANGGVEPSPFVQCSVGGNKVETNVCENTNNPVWDKGFTFFLTDPSNTEISLKVFDKPSNSALGHVEYQLAKLIDENYLEMNAAFPLQESGSNSHIQLNLQLYIMVPGMGVNDEQGLGWKNPPYNENMPIKRPIKTPGVYEGNDRASINITIRHIKTKQALVVIVHKVVNLPSSNNAAYPPNTYVKLQLVPETKDGRKKTSTIKSCNPVFDEKFEFPITSSDFHKFSLLIYTCFKQTGFKATGLFTKKKRFGKVNIALSEHKLGSDINNWFDLDTSDSDDE
ncbi:hypothetical protein CHUAL_010489 [Chamberlinius hualienensis]